MNVLQIMTNEKNFPKTISQSEYDYGLLARITRMVVVRKFYRVHSNSKEVSYLP